MKRIWAPWRIEYITKKKAKKCIFCSALKSGTKSFVVLETRYSISLLNAFPYNNGHMLVAPGRHVNDLSRMSDLEILDLMRVLDLSKKLLQKALKPDGFNIGINLSGAAGAGIPGHLHIHLLPRWKADTNFMSVLYDTRIIPQSLKQLYKQLKHAQSKTN